MSEAEGTCGSLLASFSSISIDSDLYICQLFIIVLAFFIDCSLILITSLSRNTEGTFD